LYNWPYENNGGQTEMRGMFMEIFASMHEILCQSLTVMHPRLCY